MHKWVQLRPEAHQSKLPTHGIPSKRSHYLIPLHLGMFVMQQILTDALWIQEKEGEWLWASHPWSGQLQGSSWREAQRNQIPERIPLPPQGRTECQALGIICQGPKIACKQKKKKSLGLRLLFIAKKLNREALSVFWITDSCRNVNTNLYKTGQMFDIKQAYFV